MKFPKTIQEAVDILMQELSEKDKVKIRQTKKEELWQYHFGLGLFIRNNFGLWAGNTELVIGYKVQSRG